MDALTKFCQHLIKIRIGASAFAKQVLKVLYGRRNAVEEMLLAFEVTTKAVSTKHLKQAEEDTKLQATAELSLIGKWPLTMDCFSL